MAYLNDFDPITGECTMQLVSQEVHNVTGMAYSGSVAQYKKLLYKCIKSPE